MRLQIIEHDTGDVSIADEAGVIIASAGPLEEEDAREIVQIVNVHEALVEALREARDVLSAARASLPPSRAYNATIDKADAALAEAGAIDATGFEIEEMSS